ncbi:hypothetical protein D3C85_1408510 [compost metagenome]
MQATPKVRTLLHWRDLLWRTACWQVCLTYCRARASFAELPTNRVPEGLQVTLMICLGDRCWRIPAHRLDPLLEIGGYPPCPMVEGWLRSATQWTDDFPCANALSPVILPARPPAARAGSGMTIQACCRRWESTPNGSTSPVRESLPSSSAPCSRACGWHWTTNTWGWPKA